MYATGLSDIELLRLAAIAVELPLSIEWNCAAEGRGIIIGHGNGDLRPWNPLEDDGEAFQLAMKLDMTLHLDGRGISAQARFMTYMGLENLAASGPEVLEADKPKLVRRQIVRVAAMIGEIFHRK